MSTASWLMMMCTITCYKIDYAGAGPRRGACRPSTSACASSPSVVAPTGVRAYVWLGWRQRACSAPALVQCARLWRRPQYSLFWKHAVRW